MLDCFSVLETSFPIVLVFDAISMLLMHATESMQNASCEKTDPLQSGRKTKMKNMHLKSLLARDFVLYEQELQSDRKTVIRSL